MRFIPSAKRCSNTAGRRADRTDQCAAVACGAIALAAGFLCVFANQALAQSPRAAPEYGITPAQRQHILEAQEKMKEMELRMQRGPLTADPQATAPSPEAILRERARLDEVMASKDPPEEKARVACRHLLAATYRVRPTDLIWTTVKRTQPAPFIQEEFAYFEVKDVGNTPAVSPDLSPADRLNKIQYKGRVIFGGSAYRTGVANKADAKIKWTPWKDLIHNEGQFAHCDFGIVDGEARIIAVNEILAVRFEKLSPPE